MCSPYCLAWHRLKALSSCFVMLPDITPPKSAFTPAQCPLPHHTTHLLPPPPIQSGTVALNVHSWQGWSLSFILALDVPTSWLLVEITCVQLPTSQSWLDNPLVLTWASLNLQVSMWHWALLDLFFVFHRIPVHFIFLNYHLCIFRPFFCFCALIFSSKGLISFFFQHPSIPTQTLPSLYHCLTTLPSALG